MGAKKPDLTLQGEIHGGVVTLSGAIIDYANEVGFDIVVIDTLKKPFLEISFYQEIKTGMHRLIELITLLRRDKYAGVIIFSGAGWGFYERIALSAICRVANTTCILFMVDGWFLAIRNEYFLKRKWIGLLLKIPNKIAVTGSNWLNFYKSMGLKQDRLVNINYFLSKLFRPSLIPKQVVSGEPIKFIFIGWMIQEKGLNEILIVLKDLFKKKEFLFTFIGDGPMLEDIQNTIKKENWEPRICAKGLLSNDQKKHELASSHVFVLPSYAEGFPMTLIEAMHYGLPAICSDVGGVSNSIYNDMNGFLISPKNTQELQEAMVFFINNPDLLTKYSLKALEINQKNHDADENCYRLFNLFLGK